MGARGARIAPTQALRGIGGARRGEAELRQRLHLVFREPHVDPVCRHALDCGDRDRHLALAPEVADLEEHVRNVALAIDDEPLDAPDGAVSRVHTVAPANLDLSGGHAVDHHGHDPVGQGDVRPGQRRPDVPRIGHVGHELDVVERSEPAELPQRAGEIHGAGHRRADELEPDEAGPARVVLRLDGQMRDSTGNRVGHERDDRPGPTVAARHLGTELELQLGVARVHRPSDATSCGIATRVPDGPTPEPARTSWVAARKNAHWYAVATVCVGAFMGQLDASIVLIAFPTLERDFGATVATVQWVGLSYLLVVSATIVAVGRAADIVGHKLVYTLGFVAFAAGSLLCGLAPSLPVLIGLRAVQALGAAMMQANSIAIITLAVPPHRLGRALGIQGAAQALGLSLGPLLGGLLLGLGSWRLIFLVNVPIGLLGVTAAWLLIARAEHPERRVARFDWAGLGLFGPAIGALLLAVSLAGGRGWTSPGILVLAGAALTLGAAFVLHERRADEPMLDPRLFSRPAFSLGISAGLLSYVVLFGVLFAAPFQLEHELGLSPLRSGIVLTALPLALGIAAPLAGLLADRTGPRLPAVAGLAVATASLLLLAAWNRSAPVLAAELAALGAGLGAFVPSNNTAVMGTSPAGQAGVVAGVLNLMRGVGTAIGLALAALVLGTVAGSRTTGGLAGQGFRATMLALALASALAALVAALRPAGGGLASRTGRVGSMR